VERRREAGTTEAFTWFCERCGALLSEIVLAELDVRVLRQAMDAFYASETARTCRVCGTVLAPLGPPARAE
jgi:3-hydroxyanthranilate 3,4-dioxygenase